MMPKPRNLGRAVGLAVDFSLRRRSLRIVVDRGVILDFRGIAVQRDEELSTLPSGGPLQPANQASLYVAPKRMLDEAAPVDVAIFDFGRDADDTRLLGHVFDNSDVLARRDLGKALAFELANAGCQAQRSYPPP